jgi:RNA polymerase sigma factor for flagellar operon FliA
VTEYFFSNRQMADIAADLGVTESRVSQLRGEALKLLRDGMNSQLDPELSAEVEQTGRAGATRVAYFAAIAERSTMTGRLAKTSPRAEVLPDAAIGRSRTA